MLVRMPLFGELFHTPNGTAFADLLVDGHRQTWPVRSNRFRWLRHRHYQETGTPPGAEAIRSALDLLEARAQFDGPERSVHVHVAEHAGRIYLDLADESWRAVEISADGWRVIGSPPLHFRRPLGMLSLPAPKSGGSIEALLPFVNLASRDDFILVVTWLLATLRSRGPYSVLAISGEQGLAKTVLSKLLKALIDLNAAPVRALAGAERDLMIAGDHSFLLACDNLSDSPFGSLRRVCRLTCGGSFAVRQLYTGDEELLFQAARPSCSTASTMSPAGRTSRIPQFFSPWRRSVRSKGAVSSTSGANSRSRGRASWVPFSTRRRMACANCLAVASKNCRGWPISRARQQRAKQNSLARWHILAESMTQTAGPRSRTSSMRTLWPPARRRSWPTARRGRQLPRTFCVSPPILPAMAPHG